MDCEEIDRGQLRYVVIEKGPPRLRRWFWISDHVFGDGSLGNCDAQFQQFAVNPRCAPERIVSAHCSDQITRLVRNRRTAGPTMTNFPGPIPTEALAMPGDNRFGLNDH